LAYRDTNSLHSEVKTKQYVVSVCHVPRVT
jgi:hypothetical protein